MPRRGFPTDETEDAEASSVLSLCMYRDQARAAVMMDIW